MNNNTIPYKLQLSENEIPSRWYNLRADMKNKPAPLLNPETHKPMTFEELRTVFCDELARQELDDTTPYIDIPTPIRDFYRMFRPAPLVRAYYLEKALNTPAHIYYKFEGNNTSGSHKLNSAVAQAYYAKEQGLKGVTSRSASLTSRIASFRSEAETLPLPLSFLKVLCSLSDKLSNAICTPLSGIFQNQISISFIPATMVRISFI